MIKLTPIILAVALACAAVASSPRPRVKVPCSKAKMFDKCSGNDCIAIDGECWCRP